MAWLCMLVTALGVWGVERMLRLGQDDRLSWLLIPCLGGMLSYACAMAIYHGLLHTDVWHERYAAVSAENQASLRSLGWPCILAAILGLFVGATVFVATLSFSMNKGFEVLYSL